MQVFLCPTDFSGIADSAAIYASKLAERLGAQIVLLHVMHVPAVDVYSPANIVNEMMDNQRRVADNKLGALAEKIQEDTNVKVSTKSAFGFAAEIIEETAQYLKADLICLGTTGIHSAIGQFLGSVSYDVAKRVQIPVLVIPEHVEFKEVDKIAVANDRTEPIDHELSDVYSLFGEFSPKMDVITVEPGRSEFYGCDVEKEEGGFRVLKVHAKQVSDGICTYVDTEDVDVLALKRHQRGFLEDLLHKSTIKQVLGKSHIPVIVSN